MPIGCVDGLLNLIDNGVQIQHTNRDIYSISIKLVILLSFLDTILNQTTTTFINTWNHIEQLLVM